MTIPAHIQQAIQAYYAERATPDEIAALEDWLREDEAHIRLFAELGMVEWQMLCELEKADAAAILTILREAEENAEPDYSILSTPPSSTPPPRTHEPPITVREFFSIAGYLAAKGLRTRAGVYGSIAAALMIATILVFSILGPSNTPHTQPTTDNTPTAPARPPIVATLTNTHNATWAPGPGPAASAARETARANPSHPPTPGTPLHPNQRLTLTAGFAEVTTARGAIAILQAPATIELTNNDNAIELRSGKLVGICETESSKGFVVRTPHMDITDLGTRFGVDASHADATEVHVFEGEVELVRPAIGTGQTTRITLYQGQAARTEATSDGFASIQMQPDRFAQRPGNLLLGTGQGQAAGEIDQNWRVVAVDGQPVTQHGGLIVVPEHHDGSSDPNTSQWLKINDALNPPDQRSAVFTCRSAFEVPRDVGPQTHELVIRCKADFSVKALRLNGQPIDVPNNRIGVGDKWITLTASAFIPGENTIEIDVYEVFYAPGKANSSSLRVEMELRGR